MPDLALIIVDSIRELVVQTASWLPKLIIALFIWWIGKYLIETGSIWLKKIDIPKTKLDDKIIKKIDKVYLVLAKIILLLIVLDYLGIGTSIVSAVANGITLSIAIALGLSFGRALETDARKVVEDLKKYIQK